MIEHLLGAPRCGHILMYQEYIQLQRFSPAGFFWFGLFVDELRERSFADGGLEGHPPMPWRPPA